MPRAPRQLRVGLRTKAVLILAVVVVGVTTAAAWFYYGTTRTLLQSADRTHAAQISRSLGLAAQQGLGEEDRIALQRLIGDFIRTYKVRYVAVVCPQGRTLAASVPESVACPWRRLVQGSVTVASVGQTGADSLAVSVPIVKPRDDGSAGRLLGAVRLVLDTSATRRTLARAKQRTVVIGAAIVACALPLGLVLVRRVLVRPVRQLVSATRGLARGELSARSGLQSNDEIGELGFAFDAMASEIARSRSELVKANQELEHKVAARTLELRRANERLREEIAEKEDFLRAVSHDLNAPLRNIAGMATMVLMKWRDELPEQVVSRLGRIQANVDIQTSLIGELLELSRIRSRREKRVLVDIAAMLKELADAFEYELHGRNIELVIHEPLPTLYVEKNRMRQVFQNLIDNAIKYMSRTEGGRIEVGHRLEDGFHKLYVCDNGRGIPAEQQKKIFYIFRRADDPANARVDGKGVGLALVKSVAANYEGKVYVESEPGKGSTFYVALPVERTEPPGKEAVA